MAASNLVEPREAPPRKLWTREEAARITELFPDQRYELIEGDLISKMGQKPPHAYLLMVLLEFFSKAFTGRVRVQSSMLLPDPDGRFSEPEPDLVLLHRKDHEFFERHPGPDDVALLIEVADTSYVTDRSTKYRLYARANVPEYWIIDIQRRRAIVCRQPVGEDYSSVSIISGADAILTPLAEPSFQLQLHELFAFPPPPPTGGGL